MGHVALTIDDYGDAAVLVRVAAADHEAAWAAAHQLAVRLRDDGPAGLADAVATYSDVLVTFDPLLTNHATVRAAVGAQRPSTDVPPGRTWTIPVVYGGEHGPDLDEVAAELDLEPAQVVARHTASAWIVRFCASPVGAPFLERSDVVATVRRRASPRTRVPAGSVAVSGRQSMIYPADSPGGWRLIGRTPVQLVDVGREPLLLHRPGDSVRFVAIEPSAWGDWTRPLDGIAP